MWGLEVLLSHDNLRLLAPSRARADAQTPLVALLCENVRLGHSRPLCAARRHCHPLRRRRADERRWRALGQPGATRILVPEFPGVEQTGVTPARYVRGGARQPELQGSVAGGDPGGGQDDHSLINRITGLVGYADGGGSINVQGEAKTLDIVTNDVLKKALRFTGKMGVIASGRRTTPSTPPTWRGCRRTRRRR